MITIRDKNIYYNDNIHKVQELYPNPSHLSIKINGKPTREELMEYNMCKNEDELASFCIRDANKVGARLIKKEVIKWV